MQRHDSDLSSGLMEERGQRGHQTYDFDRPVDSSGFSVAQMRLSLAGGGATQSDDMDEDDSERLQCQNDIARLNRMFNRPSGGPTVLFVVGVACVAI